MYYWLLSSLFRDNSEVFHNLQQHSNDNNNVTNSSNALLLIMTTTASTALLLVLLSLTFASHAAKGFSVALDFKKKWNWSGSGSGSSSGSSNSQTNREWTSLRAHQTDDVKDKEQQEADEPSTVSNRKRSSSSKWWHDLIPSVMDDVLEETLGVAAGTSLLDDTDKQQRERDSKGSSSSYFSSAVDALWVASPHLDVDLDEVYQADEDMHGGDGYGPVYQPADVTHFCFLVHGHRGYSRDLSYLQAVMRKLAAAEKKKQWLLRQQIEQHSSETSTASSSTSKQQQRQDELVHDLVVHSVECNERRTDDGVVNGGERLTQEILQVVRDEMAKRQSQSSQTENDSSDATSTDALPHVTISLLGNSLGGIYSRYAISRLAEQCPPAAAENGSSSTSSGGSGGYIMEGVCRFHFNIFCTTATPHLGIASHTFLPIPRTAEIGVAHAMGDTGRDLFRLNDLMKRMATAAEFIQPLRAFRHRIAYANAYGTDFPVPMQTAAFLSTESTYPHHFVEDTHDPDRLVVDDNGLVIATLHTTPHDNECYAVDDDENDELVKMSNSLDSLGWKKVFVDVRKEIPKISLPKAPGKLPVPSLSRLVPREVIPKLSSALPTSLLSGNGRRGSSSGDSSSSSSDGDDGDTNNAAGAALESESDDSENSSRTDSSTIAEQVQQQQLSNNSGAGDVDDAEHDEQPQEEQQPQVEAIHLLKEKGQAISSRDVAAALSKPLFDSQKLHLPVGHNMIVAFSRSRLWAYLNKAGRPVVDTLARDLVDSIFRWSLDNDKEDHENNKNGDMSLRRQRQQDRSVVAVAATANSVKTAAEVSPPIETPSTSSSKPLDPDQQ